jgi:hypothetical protein
VLTGKYADHRDEAAVAVALECCRGDYQRNLVMGYEALSGATLKGKAKRYGARYAASRRALLDRMAEAGIAFYEETVGPGRRRVLVIGEYPDRKEITMNDEIQRRLPKLANYSLSSNTHTVCIGPVRLYFSYSTLVGFNAPRISTVVRVNKWSSTTGKHLNAIDGGDTGRRVQDEDFLALYQEYVVPWLSKPVTG